jgi:hypothetical protein
MNTRNIWLLALLIALSWVAIYLALQWAGGLS